MFGQIPFAFTSLCLSLAITFDSHCCTDLSAVPPHFHTLFIHAKSCVSSLNRGWVKRQVVIQIEAALDMFIFCPFFLSSICILVSLYESVNGFVMMLRLFEPTYRVNNISTGHC